jgi:hypothetical protein
MMRLTLRAVLVVSTTLTLSCGDGGGDDDSTVGPDGAVAPGADADPNAPDAAPGEWTELVSGDWQMNPGNEGYVCVRKTIDQDMYISDFRAVAPEGTHHTVLTMGSPDGPDGVSGCGAGTNHEAMIYGSGVGTNPFSFPEGVAIHIPAGTQLLLNLHLFNVSDAALQGVSGTEVKTLAADEVVHVAEAVLAGKTFNLNVPDGGESTQIGYCTMDADVTVLSVSPHMHQLGTHAKIVAELDSGEMTLHDAAYDFYEQKVYPLAPSLPMAQGDRLRVECTYVNNTGADVSFGDSSTEEMCFSGIYRYPALGGSGIAAFVCDDGIPL